MNYYAVVIFVEQTTNATQTQDKRSVVLSVSILYDIYVTFATQPFADNGFHYPPHQRQSLV